MAQGCWSLPGDRRSMSSSSALADGYQRRYLASGPPPRCITGRVGEVRLVRTRRQSLASNFQRPLNGIAIQPIEPDCIV
jgi:hypothetical protein